MKVALITGVTGQIGSYLAEYLLSLDYYVIGTKRRSSVDTTWRIKELLSQQNFELVEMDLTDYASVDRTVYRAKDKWQSLLGSSRYDTPFEVYNLAAQSFVATSFTQPQYTTDVVYGGVLNLLIIIRNNFANEEARVYQASSSEMFGKNCDDSGYQCEYTPFAPQSPYAVAKCAAHHLCGMYRDAYDIYISCGIMFNVESPRRGEEFVTRKITKYVAELIHFKGSKYTMLDDFPKLKLGNINSFRDWQYCGDAVKAIHLMLQQDKPGDYVVSTGVTTQIRQFLKFAFEPFGFDWEKYVEIDESLMRPAEVDYLRGDNSLARLKLGWSPEMTVEELAIKMVKEESAIRGERDVLSFQG